jgi:hypothetical protein
LLMSDRRPRFLSLFRRTGERGEAGAAEGLRGLRVHSNFEGGNVEGAQVVGQGHLRFAARAGSSPRPLWFYFCLEGAAVPAVRCDLVNADRCFGPREGWANARPVFSADGEHWQRVARAEYIQDSDATGQFTFTVPVVGPRTYVAYCYPYTTAPLLALLRELPHRQGLRVGELCRSVENRPVPYLRFGNHESPRRAAWVIARQHAGETPASFAVEGFIRHFCRLEPPVLEALGETAFHIVPMVDVDGVFQGRYGKDERPMDFNRDWSDQPSRPEIAALARAIAASATKQRPALILDLHASHNGDTSCYLFGSGQDGRAGFPEWAGGEERFARLLAEEAEVLGLRETDLRPGQNAEGSARSYLRKRYEVPVLTVELSYHLSQKGGYLTPTEYREFGAALARASSRYLRLEG